MERKIFIFFIFLSFFKLQGFAQSSNTEEEVFFPPFRIGLALSPQVNWINPDNAPFERKGGTLSVSPEVFLDIRMWQNFYFNTGLTLSYEGGKLIYPQNRIPSNVQSTDGTASLTADPNKERVYKLHYLQFPAQVKVITDELGKWRLVGAFGAKIGLLMSAKSIDTYTNVNYHGSDNVTFEGELSSTQKIKNQMQFVNVVGTIYGGAEYKLTKITDLTFGFSYNHGFTNIFHSDHEAAANNNSTVPDGRDAQVQLHIGFVF